MKKDECGKKKWGKWLEEGKSGWKRVDVSEGEWNTVDKRRKEWKRWIECMKEEEGKGEEKERFMYNREHKKQTQRFTTICHKIQQFTFRFLGGTFYRKSVLRGTQSLCASLDLVHWHMWV